MGTTQPRARAGWQEPAAQVMQMIAPETRAPTPMGTSTTKGEVPGKDWHDT